MSVAENKNVLLINPSTDINCEWTYHVEQDVDSNTKPDYATRQVTRRHGTNSDNAECTV